MVAKVPWSNTASEQSPCDTKLLLTLLVVRATNIPVQVTALRDSPSPVGRARRPRPGSVLVFQSGSFDHLICVVQFDRKYVNVISAALAGGDTANIFYHKARTVFSGQAQEREWPWRYLLLLSKDFIKNTCYQCCWTRAGEFYTDLGLHQGYQDLVMTLGGNDSR